MTNLEQYRKILHDREKLDGQTKVLEQKIYSSSGTVTEDELIRWHKLELRRRDYSLKAARAWQKLTSVERTEEQKRYKGD